MRDRSKLQEDAERVIIALVQRQRGGERLADDVVTTVSYYLGCLRGLERAAEHVLGLDVAPKGAS
jgi:hypothetical protein